MLDIIIGIEYFDLDTIISALSLLHSHTILDPRRIDTNRLGILEQFWNVCRSRVELKL